MSIETTTTATPVASRALVRPAHIPDLGGCPPDCGHTEQEHIAFDLGVYDGERGDTVPPVEFDSGLLREAWMTGFSVGQKNRSNQEVRHG